MFTNDGKPSKIGSDFIENWVKIGASARNKIKEEHQDLDYDEQCNKCEKVKNKFKRTQ